MHDVINSLNSDSTTDGLAAARGKELKGLVDGLDNRVTALEENNIVSITNTEIDAIAV